MVRFKAAESLKKLGVDLADYDYIQVPQSQRPLGRCGDLAIGSHLARRAQNRFLTRKAC